MALTRFLLRRALVAAGLVFLAASAALLLSLMAPGQFTTEDCFADPDRCARLNAELGLDRPLLTQYADWLWRAVRLDFGASLLYTRPVRDLLRERAVNTAVLAVAALLGATLIGIPFGVYTGRGRPGLGVSGVRAAFLLLLSMPPLLSSLLLVMLAARTGWLPAGGMLSAGSADLTWTQWIDDVARHVPVPALALALPLSAVLERLQSQALRDALREPFVRAARARGLSPDAAALRHGWRVSLAAVLGLYGVMIGTLLSGSFIVEVVTAWPGLGRLMFDALRARDLYLVAGCAAAGALCLALGTFVSDVLLAVADPRAAMSARS